MKTGKFIVIKISQVETVGRRFSPLPDDGDRFAGAEFRHASEVWL